MKYKNIIKTAFWALAGLTVLVSCQTKEFDEQTELNLKRCLEPLNLNARVNASKGDEVTFSWDVNKDADRYNLVVYTDEAMTREYLNEILEPAQIPYIKRVDADAKYFFKVQAQADRRESSNWAVYDGSFKTYAVKDNLYLNATGKTDKTVSVSWSTEAPDFMEVERIDYTATKDGKTGSYALTDADKKAGNATVSGLDPSTEYDIVLFFKSASRGAVTVWTLPDASSLTRVSDSEALKAAMTAGESVYVVLSGSPYDVGSIKPVKGFSMFGESDAEGNRPVVICDIKLGTDYTGGDLYFEGIEFSGNDNAYTRVLEHNGGVLSLGSIKFVNCGITQYACGIFYDNNNDQLTLGEFVLDGCDIYNIKGSGGDSFDVRKTAEIQTISLTNNTIYDGMRTFFRLDPGLTLGTFVFDNNTVKNIATMDDGNNRGIFAIRSQVTDFSFKKNLFLCQEDANPAATTLRSQLFQSNAATLMPSSLNAADNYIYLHGADFFKQCSASDARMTVLTEDPCFNAKGNFFNLANQELSEKQVGAAKWWNAYVVKPEDLTHGITTAPHTWNFADARLFSGDVKKQMVRDGLLFVASEAIPVNADGAVNFTAATELSRKGVPVDGYVAFKVDRPGAVYVKVSDPDGLGNSVVVATDAVSGGSFKVQGGAVANTGVGTAQKILVNGISEPSFVYLYATGPVSLSGLSWTDDQSTVNTALASPKPAIDVTSVKEGEETVITVSWDAVPSAAGYQVVFDGRRYEAEGMSYVIEAEKVAALKPGSYTVQVIAVPLDSDIYNTESEAGVVAFAVLPKGGDQPQEVEKTLTWDFSTEVWQSALAGVGAVNTDITNWNLTVDGLTFVSTAKSKYNTTFIQMGGKGSTTDRYFTFTAPAGGTLKVYTTNTGSSAAADRLATVQVGEDIQTNPGGVPSTDAPAESVFTIPAGEVFVYASGNALRFFKIEFTYMEKAGPAAEDYVWDFSTETWQSAFAGLGAVNTDILNWNLTVDGLTFVSTAKSKYNTTFIQMGGKGSTEDRYFKFTTASQGVVTVYTSNTGSSAAADRLATVQVGDDVQTNPGGSPSTEEPTASSFTVPAGEIFVYASGNALRFYKIEFHSK